MHRLVNVSPSSYSRGSRSAITPASSILLLHTHSHIPSAHISTPSGPILSLFKEISLTGLSKLDASSMSHYSFYVKPICVLPYLISLYLPQVEDIYIYSMDRANSVFKLICHLDSCRPLTPRPVLCLWSEMPLTLSVS